MCTDVNKLKFLTPLLLLVYGLCCFLADGVEVSVLPSSCLPVQVEGRVITMRGGVEVEWVNQPVEVALTLS